MSITTTTLEVTPEQLQLIRELLLHHLPETTVWAFGSRVKGTARQNSDLDLVAFTDASQRMALGDLREAMEESNLPFRVDLHCWHELPEHFRAMIREQRYVVVG